MNVQEEEAGNYNVPIVRKRATGKICIAIIVIRNGFQKTIKELF